MAVVFGRQTVEDDWPFRPGVTVADVSAWDFIEAAYALIRSEEQEAARVRANNYITKLLREMELAKLEPKKDIRRWAAGYGRIVDRMTNTAHYYSQPRSYADDSNDAYGFGRDDDEHGLQV